MQTLLKVLSWAALIALILPSILYLRGDVSLDKMKALMLAATVVWFLAATPVMWNAKG